MRKFTIYSAWAAVGKNAVRNDNPNIFVLVDEGHRGQYGELHAKMCKVLPNACFDRITVNLSDAQRADLKKKFTTTDQLNKAQQKVMRIAWDISEHYRDNWQGTPYKAQLVAQDKSTALLYKKFLDEFDMVQAEVLISPPDERRGNETVEGDNPQAVQRFWKQMMDRFGSEKAYKRQLINAFKNADEPEIIIVVDMLLTGFDAPRNTVLYLTKMIKGHSLLQAIARVNRLYDGKDFGYIIDYRGVLQNLDEALDIYGQLSEFDPEGLDDLCATLTDVSAEADKLPQRHSDMWELFKTIHNTRDAEAYERLLADEALRLKFKECLEAAPALRIPPPGLIIRRMSRRWGSCSKAGTILLNLDLVQTSLYCIEYVIVHELYHLRIHRHSPAYYRLLSRCMPDREKRRARLASYVI